MSCAKNTVISDPPSTIQFGTDETLDIITWNIEGFPKNNEFTVEKLAEMIEAIDADIIAMQEIGSSSYFNSLLNKLNGWTGQRTSGSYGLAFVYKSDLNISDIYEIEELDEYELTRTPYMLEVTWKSQHVYIINNHYKCCGDGNIDSTQYNDEEYRRLLSVQMTKDYLDSVHSNHNIVLLGDMNDELNDHISDNVFQDFINAPNYTFTDYYIAWENSSSNWSFPTWPSHIDHILISSQLYNNHDTTYTIKAEQFFNSGWSEYEDYISDHRPVGIRLMVE
jgi:exonuclease III